MNHGPAVPEEEVPFGNVFVHPAACAVFEASQAFPEQDCFACHQEHAAVAHTFVQFYPTLYEIAATHGTLRPDLAN
ncbi:hypothetical protein [Chondromyces crocatus]|uniref:Cytochrome P460 domain-containing protein n=1 Tax=Chondromyces crocatus TaxID=52 RepID=A0A0K1EAM7_CHOCO|nr:hypothetical protein [Chondromyces crocatus]AKT37613.1 uncharacterized protein CMC5_017540 [Chondromyces crocatus]